MIVGKVLKLFLWIWRKDQKYWGRMKLEDSLIKNDNIFSASSNFSCDQSEKA